jgi:hypothetical protein
MGSNVQFSPIPRARAGFGLTNTRCELLQTRLVAGGFALLNTVHIQSMPFKIRPCFRSDDRAPPRRPETQWQPVWAITRVWAEQSPTPSGCAENRLSGPNVAQSRVAPITQPARAVYATPSGLD